MNNLVILTLCWTIYETMYLILDIWICCNHLNFSIKKSIRIGIEWFISIFYSWWNCLFPDAGWVRFSSPGIARHFRPGTSRSLHLPPTLPARDSPFPLTAYSYTQLLLGLSLYIFSRLYFAFLASLSILFPAVFSGKGGKESKRQQEKGGWFMDAKACLVDICFEFFNLWLYNIKKWPSLQISSNSIMTLRNYFFPPKFFKITL